MKALPGVLNTKWRKHWKTQDRKQSRVDRVWATCVFSWSAWSCQTKIKISTLFHYWSAVHKSGDSGEFPHIQVTEPFAPKYLCYAILRLIQQIYKLCFLSVAEQMSVTVKTEKEE